MDLAIGRALCDVTSMIGHLLTAAPSHVVATKASPFNHSLWLGLFIGLLFTFFGWWWLRLGLLALSGIVLASQYKLFSTTSRGVHISPSGTTVIWLIIIAIALIVGLSYGRLRGLQQLGRSELTGRWRNVRNISRW